MAKTKKRETILWLVVLAELGAILFFVSYFVSDRERIGVWEWVLFSGGFFGLLPFLTERFIFRENWKRNIFGEKISKRKLGWFLALMAASGAASWLALYFLDGKNMLKSLSFIKGSSWILGSVSLVIFLDLLILPIIIFFREAFFRGWVFFRTQKAFGSLLAVFVQAVAYLVCEAIFNWGKNDFSFGAFVFGWLCFFGRTILDFQNFLGAFFCLLGLPNSSGHFFLIQNFKNSLK